MRSMKVDFKGKSYRYILSLLDVFSRFHWLVPLERKLSSHVVREIKKIYSVHGQPIRLQSDNGGEFKKHVELFCPRRRIRMIRSRPYNPKAQGKVERSHRVIRTKIRFDLMRQKKVGVNWVKSLPEYMKCINNEKREELGWKSPFEIYFERKSNELQLKQWLKPHIFTMRLIKVHVRMITQGEKKNIKTRQLAQEKNAKRDERMMKAHARKNNYVMYQEGDKVFVRTGKKEGKYGHTRHHIVVGKVLKRIGDSDMYQIQVKFPGDDTPQKRKISVEDLATYDMIEPEPQLSRTHREKFYIKLTKDDRIDSFENQGYEIMFDPPGGWKLPIHCGCFRTSAAWYHDHCKGSKKNGC